MSPTQKAAQRRSSSGPFPNFFGKDAADDHAGPSKPSTSNSSSSATTPSRPPSKQSSRDNSTTTTTNSTNDTITAHKIPLNALGHRLDTPLAKPSPSAFKAFSERARRAKPCNELHLAGACRQQPGCAYDHAPLPPELLAVLRVLNAGLQCAQGGACRSARCYRGHRCGREGCRGAAKCRFGPEAHGVDERVVEWVGAE